LRANHAARFGIQARWPDDRPRAGGAAGLRVRVRLHMRASWTVTPLARRAEVGPRGRVRARRGLVVVLLLADVTPDAVLVPLLDRLLVVLVGSDDLHVVEPFVPLHVPAWRQDDHLAAGD